MSRIAITGLTLANVKDYGATGDGATDDTTAVQAAIDDAIASSLGGIFFPPGTYRISTTGLAVSGASNFKIMGAGEGSIIAFLTESHVSTARSLIAMRGGSSNVEIENLILDGNKAGVTFGSIETRLLDVENTTDLLVTSCTIRNSTGRATRIGDAANACDRITFHNCRITENDNSGLEFDDAAIVRIADCNFDGNSDGSGQDAGDVFIVPTVAGADDFLIEGCYFDSNEDDRSIHALGTTAAISRLTIVDCTILGSVRLNTVSNSRISDNYMRVTAATVGSGENLELDAVTNCLIRDNILELGGATTLRLIGLDGANLNVKIQDNYLETLLGVVGTTDMIVITQGDNFQISGNEFENSDDGIANVIELAAAAAGISEVEIHDNIFPSGVTTSLNATPTTGNIDRISIQDNYLASGLRFLAGAGVFNFKPVVSGNWGSVASPITTADLANLPEPAIVVGGAMGRGAATTNGATQYAGIADPEGNVSGRPGDTYQRLSTVGGAGTIFFVKESGAGTTTGWIAYSGPGRFSPPEKWCQNNVASGQTNVDLSALVSSNFDTIKAVRAGSIVGLSTRFTIAITDPTASSAIVTVTINGVPGTLAIAHSSGSNPSGGQVTQGPGVDTFVAGDLLGIEITTLGSFTPTNTDIEAWMELGA